MAEADVMAFGAHPDDIELGCGGTLIKMGDVGRSVVLVDLTRGEMSTRGTPETRAVEAEAARTILGAQLRVNLGLQDGNLTNSPDARFRIARVVRQYRPRLVLLPYHQDRHPDHYHASELIYEGVFSAGLERLSTGQQSFRPPRLMYYMSWYEFEPTFVVDISAQYERKMEAIEAYGSQFRADDPSFQQTRLTSDAYRWLLHSRMAYYGAQIGCRYGEAFLIRGRMAIGDPMDVSFSAF
ncbi:MAG: bacillithiol biosynthesis deacetylase BshB1 [Chloroflexi bacterium]|nr:bacillithiol biosynthesis deacetylase BshB1 [Chloroflexota bacterium]